MQQGNRDAAQAGAARLREFPPEPRLVERLEHMAVRRDRDAFMCLDHVRIEHGCPADLECEDVRSVLVPDAQQVPEAACDDQQRRLALALEQRVGRHRRAEPYGVDAGPGPCMAREQLVDPAHRGITRMRRVARQQLVRVQAAAGVARDDVGESAAAVDGDTPATGRRIIAHAALPPSVGACAGWTSPSSGTLN